ncbi:MAG: SIS domain-containing protein [Eubacteriales bacterium]|nr:SIS domain-containing protein [Eubacteriales bacterium]
MTIMEQEIRQQSDALKTCGESNRGTIRELAATASRRGVDNVVIAARGSSDHAANYFKYLTEIFAGLPVASAAPSVLTVYDGKLDLSHSLVVGVSQSGEAADVLAVMERAAADGAVTATLTNEPTSRLAAAARFSMLMNVGKEISVAATKTFTAEMYALGLLAAELSDSSELKSQLSAVPSLVGEVIARKAGIDAAADRWIRRSDCYVLGRGISYPAAQEIGLKLQETSYIKARSYAISDFYHGPFAVIDEAATVLVVAPKDKTARDAADMTARIHAAGADVTLFTDDEAAADCAAKVLLPVCPEFVSPFVYTVAGQLFACRLSVERGLSPDAPRGLKKVTVTK